MSLVKNFVTVGGATLSSRLLGFVRDVFMANMLGSGPIADAFFVAFRLPNLFRRLFAEGAFSSAFVPLFARALAEGGKTSARALAEDILAIFLLALVIVTALAEIGAPWLVGVLAPGFIDEPQKFAAAEFMTRVMFPYLACMSLTAMAAGMLQSFGRFAVAAFAPSLLNVILVAALILIWWENWAGTPEAAYTLSWAVCISGVAQLIAVAGSLLWIGFPVSLTRPRYNDNVRRFIRLGIPGVISGGITQINIVVGTIIASMQASAVSWLYFADRIYQLPLGVIGVAIGVVLLPDLTRRVRTETAESIFHTQNRALEFAMALTLPATIALCAIPYTIMRVLFERGAFNATDTRGNGQRADRLYRRPAGLRRHQGVPAVLLRPRGHPHANDPGRYLRGGQCRSLASAVPVHRPRRHCGGDIARRLGQRADAGDRTAPSRPLPCRRAADPAPCAARHCQPADGRGADPRRKPC